MIIEVLGKGLVYVGLNIRAIYYLPFVPLQNDLIVPEMKSPAEKPAGLFYITVNLLSFPTV